MEMGTNENVITNEVYKINEGEYASWSFELYERSIINTSVTVIDGPPIDIYLTDESGFQNYLNAESFHHYKKLTRQNIKRIDEIMTAQPGRYVLFIENKSGLLPNILKNKKITVEVKLILERI